MTLLDLGIDRPRIVVRALVGVSLAFMLAVALPSIWPQAFFFLETVKLDDHWNVELGGNVFIGDRKDTFFGQFDRNSNVYASVRYGF